MKTLLTDYSQFVARLEQLTPNSQALWGKMNVNEMLVHAAQPLFMALGQKEGEDESNFFTRHFLKHIALSVMSEIPKGIDAPKSFDVQRNGAVLNGFEADKAQLLRLMEQFKNDTSEYINRRHPNFGAFNRTEWARQNYMHLDHHFRQFGI